MKKAIKNTLKKIFSLLGLEIRRTGKGMLGKMFPMQEYGFTPKGYAFKVHPSEKDKYKWIQDLNINTVIDVGGFVGQFAAKMHEILPQAKIYSFEPLKTCFEKLTDTLSAIPNSKSFNVGLGDTKGEAIIYYNTEFAPVSSLLEPSEKLKEEFPFTKEIVSEIIEVDTLDSAIDKLPLEENILLKIDVQGFEDKVIMGGLNTLKKVKLIIIECSFQEAYKGQPLFADIYKILVDQLGFTYLGSQSQQRSPVDGHPYQEDSLFIKL